jgi:hypothetical protein
MPVLDLNNLNFDDFGLGKSGRAIRLLYNKEPVQFCTSTMYIPFGVKPVNKEWSNFTEYNMECSLNQSSSETSVAFRESIKKLDDIVQSLVKKNLSLFNLKNEIATENFGYTPILRENGTYPQLMRVNLPRDRNGNFESFIFDERKQKMPLNENNINELLSKGKTFKCIIECVKVWYFNGKVGSIWKVVQLKFSERNPVNVNNNNTEVDKVYNELVILD